MFKWLFGRKPVKPDLIDRRIWNEDWQIGDIAECIIDGVNRTWHSSVPPWERLAYRSRWEVVGFREGVDASGEHRCYFLILKDKPHYPGGYETTAFRKVRPLSIAESDVVERILSAPAGPDVVREPVYD